MRTTERTLISRSKGPRFRLVRLSSRAFKSRDNRGRGDKWRWDKAQQCSHQLTATSASASLSEISSWISSVFPESLLATELKEGEFLPPLIIRRQVSIWTSRPLFMLHISMYSCRCLFMSLFAVASSIWKHKKQDSTQRRKKEESKDEAKLNVYRWVETSWIITLD